MPNHQTIRRHAQLVDRMATAQGVDLEEQIMRGAMSVMELEDAVLSCTACTQPDVCAALLATSEVSPDKPPSFCRNADLFARLQGEG